MSALMNLPVSITPMPSADELVERARALLPMLKEKAASVEQNRMVSPETIKAFVDAGFFKILQPARWGGCRTTRARPRRRRRRGSCSLMLAASPPCGASRVIKKRSGGPAAAAGTWASFTPQAVSTTITQAARSRFAMLPPRAQGLPIEAHDFAGVSTGRRKAPPHLPCKESLLPSLASGKTHTTNQGVTGKSPVPGSRSTSLGGACLKSRHPFNSAVSRDRTPAQRRFRVFARRCPHRPWEET